MSGHSDIRDAIRAMKAKLDEMRNERLSAERERVRKSVTPERTGKEGYFRVRDSAPEGKNLTFSPFSARIQTIYRKGYDKPTYRDRTANRFITRATAKKVRGEISSKTAYNTMRQRFPNMTHDDARERVNRLTELSIQKQMGEDVDIEIGDLFGYPT